MADPVGPSTPLDTRRPERLRVFVSVDAFRLAEAVWVEASHLESTGWVVTSAHGYIPVSTLPSAVALWLNTLCFEELPLELPLTD